MNGDTGEMLYSRRYRGVPVFADASCAAAYAQERMRAPRTVAKTERDGTYLYRRGAQGCPTGSPLAGFGVEETELGGGGTLILRSKMATPGGWRE